MKKSNYGPMYIKGTLKVPVIVERTGQMPSSICMEHTWETYDVHFEVDGFNISMKDNEPPKMKVYVKGFEFECNVTAWELS